MKKDGKKTDADAAGGNLQGEAGGNGGGKVSFASLMGFGSGTDEDSASRRAEALSGDVFGHAAPAAAAKDEVSEISGLVSFKKFIRPQEGDNDMVVIEEGEVTGLQARVLERMRVLRDLRIEKSIEFKSEEHPVVKKIDEELLNLNAFLGSRGNAPTLDTHSVLFDVSRLQQMAGKSRAPEGDASAGAVEPDSIPAEILGENETRDISGEIDQELEDSGAKIPALDEPATSTEEGGAYEDPAWMNEILADPIAPGTHAMPPPLSEVEDAEDDSIDGRPTPVPRPVSDVSDRELEKLEAIWLSIASPDYKEMERELLGVGAVASPQELRQLAEKIRERADFAFGKDQAKRKEAGKWYKDFVKRLQDGGADTDDLLRATSVAKMEFLGRAEQLDMLAAQREALVSGQAPVGIDAPSSEEIDSWGDGVAPSAAEAQFVKAGASGMYRDFVDGKGNVDVKKLYVDPTATQGSVVVSRGAKRGEAGKEVARGMGIPSGSPAKAPERTMLGLRAAGAKDTEGDAAVSAAEEKPAAGLGKTQAIASGTVGTGSSGAPSGLGTQTPAPRRGKKTFMALPKAAEAPANLNRTEVVAPEFISEAAGGQKFVGDAAFDKTRLSSVEGTSLGTARGGDLGATKNEKPKEDFSIYGDIYYAVEKVYMETTGIPPELNSLNNFAAMLPDAIKKAEMLAKAAKGGELDEGEKLKKGETQIIKTEEARVARLRIFQEDFLEIPKGKEEPKKSLLAYNEWLANKKQEYAAISDVHELLGKAQAGDLWKEGKYGVSPGEYGRIGMLRLCNAAIKTGALTEQEEAKVGKLREMLEPVARGESDIFAQTIAADATYEMMVGFATKQERARVRQLEAELGKYKISVEEYEAKREQMVKVLVEALVSTTNAEADAAKTKEKLKQAILGLAPNDPFERSKYVKLVMDAQAGKGGEAGKELRGTADKLAATMDIPADEAAKANTEAQKIAAQAKASLERSAEQRTMDDLKRAIFYSTEPKGKPQAQAVPAQKAPKQHGPIASGIGTAIKVAVGAGLVVGTLWLSEHGIITLGTRADESAQKPVAAQVEDIDENSVDSTPLLSLETLELGGVSYLRQLELKEAKEAGSGTRPAAVAGVAPVENPDAEVKVDSEVAASAQPKAGAEPPKEYSRGKAGLKMALDDWCQNERGLLVSGGMLRAAYASIESGLDGKVLPQDGEWARLMLRMKFPNRVVELAVMSDLARNSVESDDAETHKGLLAEKYAAYMRLSIVLGNRAGNPKSFQTTIKEANAKGPGLPQLDKESHVGKIEAKKVGERCLFSAYHQTVTVVMAKIKEDALAAGMSAKAFMAKVRAVLGGNAERIEKLAETANYEADQEESEGPCRALTGGKKGAAALERAGVVADRWEESHERAKAKAEQYEQGVNEVLGSAPAGNAPAAKAKKPGKAAPSLCAGKDGLDLYSCIADQNTKSLQAGRDTGKKSMHAPKPPTGKEAGAAGKAPHGPVRY